MTPFSTVIYQRDGIIQYVNSNKC